MQVDIQSLVSAIARRTEITMPRQKPAEWSAEEIDFLHKQNGILDDNEIAVALGRTQNAIKIFRVRSNLKACSQAGKAWVTANKGAKLLGVDIHKITYWCRVGLIPAKFRVHAASGREYILINREMLKRWCVNLRNWVYIDWRLIQDPLIRRLCELRAARWGDEWWETNRVAEYHGVNVQDVKRLIARGEIQSYRPEFSLGGRHLNDTWRNHFVLKSEATRPDLVFYRRKGKPGISKKYSPAFDSFLLKARDELGLEWGSISKLMKAPQRSCAYLYSRLKKN